MADRSAGCLKKDERKRVPWTFEEDIRLISYITLNGEGRWDFLAKASGLNRSGRSCRLRWVNYLSPDLNHTNMTLEEERLIVDLHSRWGNRWSLIAQSLPGRTDNRIKKYWKTHLKKKVQLQENDESKVHCESSTRSSSIPSSSQKAKEPCMIHITEAEQNTVISSFHANTFPYTTNEFESEAQKATAPYDVQFRAPLAQEEYSTDLDYNFSWEIFSSELHRNNELRYSLHNSPSPEAFSNTEFYSDELWNMDE